MNIDPSMSKYVAEIEEYLTSKIPEVPSHTIKEIAAHVGNNACILVCDIVRERDKEWRNSYTSGTTRKKSKS